MKIKTFGHIWTCPKCNSWNRTRGLGEKIKKCRECGFKVKVCIVPSGSETFDREIIFIKKIK